MEPCPSAALEKRLRLEGWTLHQRLDWIATQGLAGERNSDSLALLRRWQHIVGPDSSCNFDKRLLWDGLTPDLAARVLAPDPSNAPVSPGWWPVLEDLRCAARNHSIEPGLTERCVSQPFVHLWRPVASWALHILRDRCHPICNNLSLTHDAWLDLAEPLLERLSLTADQALWDQFNQRRTPGQILLAHLGPNGDGSDEPIHEAYDTFVVDQLNSGYSLLLSEYPVLGRLLAVVTQLWLEGTQEMLTRLADSRLSLHEHFGIELNAPLVSVQFGLSDPHRGGRAVAILGFANSTNDSVRRVVYKPKDMRVDASYQLFLGVLNDASGLPPLRRLQVLCGDSYGFMEWVEHRVCTSDSELSEFYHNAGRTMAVLHVLGCTDCHYENLIASGNNLLLIDTETLLEADLRDLVSDNADDPDLISELQTSMQGSVLRSGLLPQWLMAGAGRKVAFDISALGIEPPPAAREMPSWLGLNTDGMIAGRSIQACELPTSLPVPLGSPQRLTDFVDELCAGFALQLEEVIRLRSTLLNALEFFTGQPRRLVARATRLYFTIQRQMLEPAALRSAVAHGLKLEQLSRSFVLAADKPSNWSMFTAEIRQMERLDIPFFEHLIDSYDLPLPEGLEPIPDFMKASGLDAARRRLKGLTSLEISFQQQLIRGAIAARQLRPTGIQETPAKSDAKYVALVNSTEVIGHLEKDVYRSEAFRLGEELWSSAIRDHKGRPEWLGMDLAPDGESFHFGLIGNSLYSGASGIAVLFARLALACADHSTAEQWRLRAWSCFKGLVDMSERSSNDSLFRLVRDLPYGLTGSGGTLLALSLLANAGLDEAAQLAQLLLSQVRSSRLLCDEGTDVIGGITGLLGVLLRSPEPNALDLAAACGERLISTQLESGGWPSNGAGSTHRPALTGFSHGAAGMAAALARLSQVSGESRFANAAQRAIAYERSVFVEDKSNWPDFRGSIEPTSFMTSWCHGAPGILLSRLVLLSAGLKDVQTASELQAARTTTLVALQQVLERSSVEPASHLCCGVFGLTSLLRIDAAATGGNLDPLVPSAETFVISQAQRNGTYTFFSVENGSLNLPGLLTGKAGVALALLEAADSLRFLPDVLSAGLLSLP